MMPTPRPPTPHPARSPRLPALAAALALVAFGCGGEGEQAGAPEETPSGDAGTTMASGAPPTPADLDRALVLALAQFEERETEEGRTVPEPGAARLEFLVRRDGEWSVSAVEDDESNVFHKAMAYETPGGEPRLLTVAGTAATVKLWSAGDGGLESETLWEKDFGGRFSRMRDVEVADLYGEGRESMAVATHDQGVVAVIRPGEAGGFQVQEVDRREDTFVHEIELGDLDGDGTLEVYSTPSDPNRFDGEPQTGRVTRYVPARDEGRQVVADLGQRHAKEIYVGDVDGNARDELYVVVEGEVEDDRLVEPVEVRRYEGDTPADGGAVIAEVEDRLARFLTAGDVEGDGRQELVLAAFRSGLWLLRPGDDPMQPWTVTSIDRESGGFEHAALLTDLDGDGRDELYVASDKHHEVRRYAWDGEKLAREVIYSRPDARAVFTWNIMPVPLELVPESE